MAFQTTGIVNLQFNANTAQAKQQLQSLQTQLQQITNLPLQFTNGAGLTKQMQEASQAAMQLQTHLKNATNVQTGNLDFTRLNESLKRSGISLSEYGQKLMAIGPQGQKAFMSVASSIAQAEIPLRRVSPLMTKLMNQFKATMRYQLSAAMIQGLVRGVRDAFNYTKELDTALNNIRIVTGKSSEEMAKFAADASRAAKALSATTTEYTKASLIYYQQGLNTDEAMARADTTVKMAKVVGQSAETVSNQLTAVWNNFYDGSKSLEYYADVMAKLGATTASSTNEIATGLEKFAAIASTVGLSYEYATSALATVTAETRQSADVVGTAFKTLFARIQDLELGNTLDDGTTLGKYSEALNAVGINIKDANGQLKDMDAILDEMGNKWDKLSKDTQVALAQTVGGTRQYAQLIALMDNWDKFQTNLGTANNASGTLQDQADIYAESWDAAKTRVKNSLQSLYDSLIDKDFFIGLFNVLDKVVGAIDTVVESMGGMSGVLTTLGVVATKVFGDQIANGLRNMVANFKMSTQWGINQMQQLKAQQVQEAANTMALGVGKTGDPVGSVAATQYREQLRLQSELAQNERNMDADQLMHAKQLLEIHRQIGEQVIKAKEAQESAKGNNFNLRVQAISDVTASGNTFKNQSYSAELGILEKTTRSIDLLTQSYQRLNDKQELSKNQSRQLVDALRNMSGENEAFTTSLQRSVTALGGPDLNQLFTTISKGGSEGKAALDLLADALARVSGNKQKALNEMGISNSTIEAQIENWLRLAEAERAEADANLRGDQVRKDVIMTLEQSKQHVQNWSQSIVAGAQALMSFGSILSSLSSLVDTWSNPDLSGWEKFVRTLTTGSMALMMTISMMNALTRASSMWQAGTLKNVIAGTKNIVMTKLLTAAQREQERATKKAAAADAIKTASDKAQGDQATITAGQIRGQNTALAAESGLQTKGAVTDGLSRKARRQQRWNTRAWNNLSAQQQGNYIQQAGYTQTKNGRYRNVTTGKFVKSSEAVGAGQQAAGKAAAKSLGQIASKAALVAAAIAVIVAVIIGVTAVVQKYEKAAKKAAEQAKLTAEAYASVSEQYNTFVSNMESYNEAQEGMKKLTKGTIEYQEALLKANEEALKLIETYDDLKYTTDKDGLITIDQESLKQAQEEQLQAKENAQVANQLAQQNASNKALEAEKVKFSRKELKSNADIGMGALNIANATVAGGGAGALAGTAVNAGYGTAIGAAIGAGVGLISGIATQTAIGSAREHEGAALDKLAEAYSRQGASAFTEQEFAETLKALNLGDSRLEQSLKDNREATLKLVKEMAANTEAQLSANKSIVTTQMSDKLDEMGMSSETKEAVIENFSRSLDKYTEDAYNDKWKRNGGDTKDADIQKLYAEAMGWDTTLTENKVGNKATYYDKNGNVVAENLSDEVARRYLAQQDAIENTMVEAAKVLQETFESLDKEINQLESTVKGTGNALKAWREWIKTGDLSTASESEVEALRAELDTKEQDGNISQTEAELYLSKQPEAVWKAYGDTLAEAATNLAEDLNTNYQDALNTVTSGITTYAKEAFGTIDEETRKEASAVEQTAIAQDINEAMIIAGREGADTVAAFYEAAGDEIGDVATALSDADWPNMTVAKLTELLADAGVATEYTAEELQGLIDVMREEVTKSLESMTQYYKSINDIVKDLEAGATISEENYSQLSEGMQSYFMLMADGTYKLIGDALDFKEAVAGALFTQWQEVSDNLRDDLASQTKLESLGKEQYAQNLNYLDKTAPSGLSYQDYVYKESGGQLRVDNNGIITVDYSLKNRLPAQLVKQDVASLEAINGSTAGAIVEGNYDTWNVDTGDGNGLQPIKLWDKESYEQIQEKAQLVYESDISNTLIDAEQKDIAQLQLEILGETTWAAKHAQELTEWQEKLTQGTLTLADAQEIYNVIIDEGVDTQEAMAKIMAKTSEELQKAYEVQFSLRETAQEREDLLNTLSPGQIGYEELEAAYNKAAAAAINEEAWEGLEVEEVQQYADHLKSTFNMAEEEANEVARATMKMNKGVEDLNSNWEEWNSILTQSSESSEEYSKAMLGTRKALSNILDVSEDFIDADFVTQHLEEIGEAAEGDAEAIDALSVALARNIAEMAAYENITSDDLIDLNFDSLDEAVNHVTTLLDEIDTLLETEMPSINLGDSINTGDLFTKLQQVVAAAQMTTEEANAYYRSMGFTPKFKTTPITADVYATRTTTHRKRTYINYPNEWVDTDTIISNQEKVGEDVHTAITMATEAGGQTVQVPSPEVESLTYTGGGSMNNFSSSNAGGKSSGGGGGSKKEKKNINDEKERYHYINQQLEDLAREYDQVGKAADRAFGKTRLTYLDQQIEKQEELIEVTEDYLNEIDGYLAEDREVMVQYGAVFDEDGRLANYDALMQANVDQYNWAVDQYNSGAMSEEVFEGYEKAYDKFISDMEQYEETLNLREEAYIDYLDKLNELIDLKLGQIEYKVELDISISDDAIKLIEFQLDHLGDTAEEAFESIESLWDAIRATESNIQTYRNGLRDILAINDEFTSQEIDSILNGTADLDALLQDKELTDAQIQAIRDYRDGLMDSIQAMEGYKTQIEESVITAFEELNERMSTTTDILEHQKTIVQGFQDIVDLIGADNLGLSDSMLKSMRDTSVKLATDQVAAAKTILETRKAELAAAQDQLDQAIASGDEDLIDYWQDTVDTIAESVREAESDMMSSWTDALQTAADALAAATEQIIKNFEKQMSGMYGTLEALQEAFDRNKEISELYLDDYEKIYNLSKLNRDIAKSIDDTDSVVAKSRLRDLQEEINALQESGTEMSQYEVDALRAKYELRLAEIALEEAQNAKSQVRMSRDSEGNWSYVYTADEAKIDNAQQNYEDKLYAFQQLTQDYIQNAQEQIMAIPTALSEALAAINKDTTLTEEAREQKIQETIQHYQRMYDFWISQLGISIDDANELYNIDWAAYAEATGYKLSSDSEWTDSWNETTYAQLTGLNSMEEAQNNFVIATNQMVSDLNDAWSTWQDNIDSICQEAGSSMKDFSSTTEEALAKASDAANETKDDLAEMANAGKTAFDNVVQAAGDKLSSWQSTMAKYRAEIEAEVAALNNLISTYAQADAARAGADGDTGDQSGGTAGNEQGGKPTSTDNDNDRNTSPNDLPLTYSSDAAKAQKWLNQRYGAGLIVDGLWGNASQAAATQINSSWKTAQDVIKYMDSRKSYVADWYDFLNKKWTATVAKSTEADAISTAKVYTKQSGQLANIPENQIAARVKQITSAYKFDTGGYTGSWDSSSRLAMLHQKELVLNAHDTENFLSAVDILRDITAAIDLRALASSRYMSDLSQVTAMTNNMQGIEQNITIHAEFPNATDRNEIQEAFNTLLNHSSQFANRKI